MLKQNEKLEKEIEQLKNVRTNKEQLENQLMKIQAKNGLICLWILGTLA